MHACLYAHSRNAAFPAQETVALVLEMAVTTLYCYIAPRLATAHLLESCEPQLQSGYHRQDTAECNTAKHIGRARGAIFGVKGG